MSLYHVNGYLDSIQTTGLGRLGKHPLTRPSIPDPFYGLSFRVSSLHLTIFRTCVHELPSRQSTTELVRKENLFETDKLKSGVKPSIRRTGAEIIDFLVLENILVKMVTQTKE